MLLPLGEGFDYATALGATVVGLLSNRVTGNILVSV